MRQERRREKASTGKSGETHQRKPREGRNFRRMEGSTVLKAASRSKEMGNEMMLLNVARRWSLMTLVRAILVE